VGIIDVEGGEIFLRAEIGGLLELQEEASKQESRKKL